LDHKVFRRIILLGLACLVLYFLVRRTDAIQANVSRRDSIQYWAGGKLLVSRQNPYDLAKVSELERSRGYQGDRPLVIRTPPWSLFLFVPLGLLNAFWAWLLWIVASLACLVIAMRICWQIYDGDADAQSSFSLVGYTFAPVPACLVAGQMGLLLLIGLLLFFRYEAKRPFLAGASLILPFAKPHLLSLFWVALLLWILWRKKYAVAYGFASALVAATAVAMAFDPGIFRDYRNFLPQAAIGGELIPAVSGVIRAIFFRQMFWVQFLPLALALIWCVPYFLKNRGTWNWRQHAPALMVVSVLTTPYAWLSDEVVLLPAILQAAMWIYSVRKNLTVTAHLVIVLFAGLNALLLLILSFKIPFATGIYFWSSLVWFSFYFYGRRLASPLQTSTTRGNVN
jgi:hypothetical protein